MRNQKANSRRYYLRHKAERDAYNYKWQAENPDRVKAALKKWRQSEKGKLWQQQYQKTNRERLTEIQRRYRENNKAKVAQRKKVYCKNNRIKCNARNRIYLALKRGIIVKSTICDSCKAQTKTEGHHFKGYHAPLEVIWLCRRCHAKCHPAK